MTASLATFLSIAAHLRIQRRLVFRAYLFIPAPFLGVLAHLRKDVEQASWLARGGFEVVPARLISRIPLILMTLNACRIRSACSMWTRAPPQGDVAVPDVDLPLQTIRLAIVPAI